MDDDNIEIPRSVEEQLVFSDCLPNMGLLYSMFPVLILEEVNHGIQPYSSSGWCFSESNIALLGHQLHMFSQASHLWVRASIFIWETFQDTFDQGLEDKIFFPESDRTIVKNIMKDFFYKRQVMEAIQRRRVNHVQRVLSNIVENRRWSILDQLVDQILNTPLHVAVRVGDTEVVRALIASGPHLTNIRGD